MLYKITSLLRAQDQNIQAWFSEQWQGLSPQLYLSCDIRHSGFKIAAVDTNIFPAGFNNLCSAFSRQTSQAFAAYLDAYHPTAQKILIYGEEHTRNKFYLKNLCHIKKLIEKTGREVVVGMLGEFLPSETLEVQLESETMTLHRLNRENDAIVCGSFKPDLIVSNNDFSTGLPALFSGIEQPVIPNPNLGWFTRKKDTHFKILKTIFEDFGQKFDIDPWHLYAVTDVEKDVDLSDDNSLSRLAQKVELLLDNVRTKYLENNIQETPYAYLKSNTGTYGMGLLPVFSGEEVLSLNRKKRNKLLSSKGNLQTTEFLIQEGIPTIDFYSGYPLEPVIYVVGKEDVGGFFRIHESKNALESLNAPGMTFSCLCLHKLDEPHERFFIDCGQKEEVVFLSRFLARIAALATAVEGKELK